MDHSPSLLLLLCFLAGCCTELRALTHSSYVHGRWSDCSASRSATTRLCVLHEPSSSKRMGSSRSGIRINERQSRSDDEPLPSLKLQNAQRAELQLMVALESLEGAVHSSMSDDGPQKDTVSVLLFPNVRACNSALATFGDRGELLRALRLFMKMRKAAAMGQRLHENAGVIWTVPSPTLVTYSTLMSRANKVGKPRVALRMWNLMVNSRDFFAMGVTTTRSFAPPSAIIVPDLKAVNILMNSFAKLADVSSAHELLNTILTGDGSDVPRMTPNLVTFNTLLDACSKAGDLDLALKAKAQLEEVGLQPDARTYTTLIATVARKPSSASGANDPSLAFSLLSEMKSRGIQPNGITYSALIDVCGRCRRSDLALQGLRMMLREKSAAGEVGDANEVGAWTATINAFGKSGRVDGALKLFYSMPNFGVQPNTISCGCLTDCLLKHGRTDETLKVLQYMEKNGIVPTEVMYTSLMTSAGRLLEIEQKSERGITLQDEEDISLESNSCRAIEVYTELMKSLMKNSVKGERGKQRSQGAFRSKEEPNTLLMKVYLVFQEMKAAGAEPDLACYNALLKACAKAGDLKRARNVLEQIKTAGMDPNDASWRELIKAAAALRQPKEALSIWQEALHFRNSARDSVDNENQWEPSVETFSALIFALIRGATSRDASPSGKISLYRGIVTMFERILSGERDEKLGMHLLSKHEIFENQRTMLLILQAIVVLEEMLPHFDKSKGRLRELAIEILELECILDMPRNQWLRHNVVQALRTARTWKT